MSPGYYLSEMMCWANLWHEIEPRWGLWRIYSFVNMLKMVGGKNPKYMRSLKKKITYFLWHLAPVGGRIAALVKSSTYLTNYHRHLTTEEEKRTNRSADFFVFESNAVDGNSETLVYWEFAPFQRRSWLESVYEVICNDAISLLYLRKSTVSFTAFVSCALTNLR